MSWLDEHVDREASLELTPLIDIVFIILIFFITVSSFTVLPAIELPRTPAGERPSFAHLGPHALVIRADPKAPLVYGDRDVSRDNLSRRLEADIDEAGGPDRLTLRIYADRTGAFDRVRGVIALATRLGVRDVRLATLSEAEKQ